jgi:hypothetical protein
MKYKDYKNIIIENIKDRMTSVFDDADKSKQFGENIISALTDNYDNYRQIVVETDSNPDSIFLEAAFKNIIEIENSLESAKNIAILLRRRPTKKQISEGLTLSSFLKINIHSYFEEMYILHERIESLYKFYKKSLKEIGDKNTEELEDMKKLSTKAFKRINRARGSHIHSSRYDDRDLRHLEALDFYIDNDSLGEKNTNMFKLRRELSFRSIRKKWLKNIQNDTTAVEKLLDKLFEIMDGTIKGLFKQHKIRGQKHEG